MVSAHDCNLDLQNPVKAQKATTLWMTKGFPNRDLHDFTELLRIRARTYLIKLKVAVETSRVTIVTCTRICIYLPPVIAYEQFIV